MSYTALYRKFRPSRFEDVKGQEHIVTTLQNQIKADRIGHAYLFCGTRGTGKTSVAKIFARAVNCENPAEGSPCGECASCKALAAGAGMNVIEIDAASNNGVDNIREIVDEVSYSPAEAVVPVNAPPRLSLTRSPTQGKKAAYLPHATPLYESPPDAFDPLRAPAPYPVPVYPPRSDQN